MSSAIPLTPAEAIAVAAILEVHPRRLAHWAAWVAALRTWAQQQQQTEHKEGEMPSQDEEMSPRHDRIGSIKQAPSGVLSGPPAQGSNPSGGAMQSVPESGSTS